MTPAEVTLEQHVEGDRFHGISAIGPASPTPANALTRVRMHFRDANGVLGFRFDSQEDLGNALITITNAATWTCTVPVVEDFPLTEGEWSWDMEVYEAGHEGPKTICTGTLTVLPQVTR